MTELHVVGEFIRLNDSYDWGGGKHAGKVVRIALVQDAREAECDEDALIYEAEFVNDHGEVCDRGIPVLPRDIDESYDYYEARRARDWNRFAEFVTGGPL